VPLEVLLDEFLPGQRADYGVRSEMGRRLERERCLLGLCAGYPVQSQRRDRAAIFAAVAGSKEQIQQCLQRLDVLARDWLQFGLSKVNCLYVYPGFTG